METKAKPSAHCAVYLRAKEVAEYTGLSESKLAKWRMNGRPFGAGPPFRKVGKTVLYHRHELDKWLEAHTACSE